MVPIFEDDFANVGAIDFGNHPSGRGVERNPLGGLDEATDPSRCGSRIVTGDEITEFERVATDPSGPPDPTM